MVGGQIAAFNLPAIPLLIKAWDEKALPHLRERQIAGAKWFAVNLWCIWSLGFQTFVGDVALLLPSACFCKPLHDPYVDRTTVCTVSWDLLVEGEISVWRSYFFIWLTAEVSVWRVDYQSWRALSSLIEWAGQHSYTLPLDRLHDQSVSPRWFRTWMISALCVWRWSVISLSRISSPSTSLKEVHC